MAFLNSYQSQALTTKDLSVYLNFGPDPYDINFCFPIDFATLETEKVKLLPFIPRLYAEIYLEQTLQHRDLNVWYSAKPPRPPLLEKFSTSWRVCVLTPHLWGSRL